MQQRQSRQTGQQQQPAKSLIANKAAAKLQEPSARQSFRGQMASNPLRTPVALQAQATKEADYDSDDEQWERVKAAQKLTAAAGPARRGSAAISLISTAQAAAKNRRPSHSQAAAPGVAAQAADVNESDSDDDTWQRMKMMAVQRQVDRATLSSRTGAPPTGRLSISKAARAAAPSQTTAQAPAQMTAQQEQSDSDDERWGQVKASAARSSAGARLARSGGGAVLRGRHRASGGDQRQQDDSDEEQWQRVKAQMMTRAPPVAGTAIPHWCLNIQHAGFCS